jgi:hypothetical protein
MYPGKPDQRVIVFLTPYKQGRPALPSASTRAEPGKRRTLTGDPVQAISCNFASFYKMLENLSSY